MGRLGFSDDESHGGAEAPRVRQLAHLLIAITGIFTTSVNSTAQAPPDCHRRDTVAIAAHERAALEAPKAFLLQVALAGCYDQAWQFRNVEPVIIRAAAILEAEFAGAAGLPTSVGARPIAGESVPSPKRTRDKQADYPDESLAAGASGFVVLELVIDPQGNVREPRVVKSVRGLDVAALNAARKWKYEPTLGGGNAVEVVAYAAVRFGQGTEPLPSDWLEMSAFYYGLGLRNLTRAALKTAAEKVRSDLDRFDGYIDGRAAAAPGGLPGVTLPAVLRQVDPRYPRRAISAHADGIVRLEGLVDARGDIGRVRMITTPSVLDASAGQALLQWKFKPALKNGTPVPTSVVVEMEFRLR